MVSSRRGGVAARGSITRASLRSSVVTESATLARPSFAMAERMSMSRVTSADLVTIADGMAEFPQHFQDRTHDAVFALDRLIGIGVGADRHHRRAVARLAQLGFQQLRRVRLEQKLRLEIEAGRQAEIGVGRPRETIDAAMLAAAIGIDRAVERDVGRAVPRDDGARRVFHHLRAQGRRRLVLPGPAIVEADIFLQIEAARGVGARAAAVDIDAGGIGGSGSGFGSLRHHSGS